VVISVPKSKVEQWLIDHSDTSCNYHDLVARIKSGEQVECVVENDNRTTVLALAEYRKTGWGGLFKISLPFSDALSIADEMDFIAYCDERNLIFEKQDFLKSTRKLLEIAKNTAEFQAIMLPLNTPQDVDALLTIMDRANESV
jgi:hypothetical protein